MYDCPICENPLIRRVTVERVVHEYYCKTCNRDFSEDIKYSEEKSIKPSLVEAQDFMDNACYDLIKQFRCDAPWDISEISEIRESLIEILIEHGLHEYDLYPWILEES